MAQAAPQKVTQPTIDAKGQQVTAALNKVLHDKVSSPGGKLQLQVQPTTRAGEGYFSEVYIAAHPAKIKKMRMTDLALRARNVHVDVPYLLKTGKVTTLASTTTLRAVVTEADLDDLLAHGKSTASMHLKVKYLGGDRVQVAGDWNWSLLSGPVVGVGRLRLAPGYKVNVDVLSLKLNGAELPGFIKNKFSQKLNPLIDYNDVPFQPRFKGIKVQGDKAILFA
ncbi:MAG: DUF2993 domain-containing protein [Abitibacteriaceae bacterium]|nr:DUF2993 domain-containing protein [Abditibacteriaceae bacterium]